jgi:ATP-dependent helicase/nuclease subunit B
MSKQHLSVYTNARTIRQSLETQTQKTQLLNRTMTIAEFESRAQSFEGRHSLDDDSRHILLKEAADFDAFSLLKIERDFLRFIKSSPSLLRFFEELSKEKVSFEALSSADTYAEYESHLLILKTLYERYLQELDKHHAVDAINAPLVYQLNVPYLENLSCVELFFDGYMTRYEITLFEEIARYCKVVLHFVTSAYTDKMHDRFSGFELKSWHQYHLNLSSQSIEHEKVFTVDYHITRYATSSRLLQVASVKLAISKMIKEGCLIENIAIVLPDENFSPFLQYFDHENNFNFAMGKSFKKTDIYQKLNALFLYRNEENSENKLRMQRMNINVDTLQKEWHTICNSENFTISLKLFSELIKVDEEKYHFIGLLHQFNKLGPVLVGYSFRELFHLFLSRLGEIALESAGGGKVTVMGLLETRGVKFDGVIIVDFNEGYAPKLSNKDMYLNSTLRHHAKLPTRSDRLALQMDYYHKLFASSDKVALTYVNNEEHTPSPFIELMKLKSQETIMIDERYFSLLVTQKKSKKYQVPDIKLEVNLLSEPLSASKLKRYLQCKRAFYYQYITRLKSAEVPSDTMAEYEMGNILHLALEKLYKIEKSFESKTQLKLLLHEQIKLLLSPDLYVQFQSDIWLKKLERFIDMEITHFSEGYEVLLCEERFSVAFEGANLTGVIDRIDKKANEVIVLDYKSGKFPEFSEKNIEKTDDFQLLFYALAATGFGNVEGAYYYDLKSGALVQNHFLQEQKVLLKQHLLVMQQSVQSFDLCEDLKHCRYCDYAVLCERD